MPETLSLDQSVGSTCKTSNFPEDFSTSDRGSKIFILLSSRLFIY